MAIKINYFNSFVLKKTVNNVTSGNAAYQPVFPGLPNNPTDYPTFGANASDDITNVINNLSPCSVSHLKVPYEFLCWPCSVPPVILQVKTLSFQKKLSLSKLIGSWL